MYFIYYILLGGLVVVLDQLSKLWILDNFKMFDSVEIVPNFFNLIYVVNPGAAFSFLADVDSPWRHYFFIGVGVVALVGLSYYIHMLRNESKWYHFSLSLIAGGAVGNLIDRVSYGHVIDFLDVYYGSYHWPAFNVADSAICVGVGIYLVKSITESRKEGCKKG
ncbi:MAG: signal peptidase II [Desulfotalea sp.]